MRTIRRNGESELEQKLLTPTSRDNDVKTDVVCCCLMNDLENDINMET